MKLDLTDEEVTELKKIFDSIKYLYPNDYQSIESIVKKLENKIDEV